MLSRVCLSPMVSMDGRTAVGRIAVGKNAPRTTVVKIGSSRFGSKRVGISDFFSLGEIGLGLRSVALGGLRQSKKAKSNNVVCMSPCSRLGLGGIIMEGKIIAAKMGYHKNTVYDRNGLIMGGAVFRKYGTCRNNTIYLERSRGPVCTQFRSYVFEGGRAKSNITRGNDKTTKNTLCVRNVRVSVAFSGYCFSSGITAGATEGTAKNNVHLFLGRRYSTGMAFVGYAMSGGGSINTDKFVR